MSERKGQGKAAPTARPSRHGAGTVEQANAATHQRPTTAELEAGLRNFLLGHDPEKDTDLRMDGVLQLVDDVLDDELLQSADSVFAAALFMNDMIDYDMVQSFIPLHDLCRRLRELQQSRLRDAIATLVKTSHN